MKKLIGLIGLKTAGVMGFAFFSLTILLHILVLTRVIPFIWINGGRSASLAEQVPVSIANIVIAIVGIVFTLFASGFIQCKFKRTITVISWLLVVYWSIGFVQQLIGTYFEKTVCVLLLLLGLVSALRIAMEKR